jgi:hypothetical protein
MNGNEQKNYLKGLVTAVAYDDDLFTLRLENDNKAILGVMGRGTFSGMHKHFEYKTLYDSVIHLDLAVNMSLNLAIDYAYENYEDEYNPFSQDVSESEMAAIYYIENAVFRTAILWDMLAQLFNVKHNLIADKSKIFYKSFLKKELGKVDATNATVITDYLEQDDNTDNELWQGNHVYISEYRNQMTHRNSPNVNSMSNYACQIRLPARYVLKRVVEDYSKVSEFIKNFIDDIDIKSLLEMMEKT